MYETGGNSSLFMVKKICPADHFCRNRSDTPTPCAWGARCPEGTETPQRSPLTLVLLLLVYVTVVLIYLGYTKLKQSQQKMYMDIYHSTLEKHKELEREASHITKRFTRGQSLGPQAELVASSSFGLNSSSPTSFMPSNPSEAYLGCLYPSDAADVQQHRAPTVLSQSRQQTTVVEYGMAFGNRGSDEVRDDAAATALEVESIVVTTQGMPSSSATQTPDADEYLQSRTEYSFLLEDSVLGQYIKGGVSCAKTEEPLEPFKFMGLTYKRSQIGFQFCNLDLKIKLAQTVREMLSGQCREAQVAGLGIRVVSLGLGVGVGSWGLPLVLRTPCFWGTRYISYPTHYLKA